MAKRQRGPRSRASKKVGTPCPRSSRFKLATHAHTRYLFNTPGSVFFFLVFGLGLLIPGFRFSAFPPVPSLRASLLIGDIGLALGIPLGSIVRGLGLPFGRDGLASRLKMCSISIQWSTMSDSR